MSNRHGPAPAFRRWAARCRAWQRSGTSIQIELTKLVRGDLDWIVMKALEKDRLRRYDTAASLSADVERHLSGEAVLAAPPTVRYRARKFILRNKGAVLAGTLVASSLLLGIVGFAWQAHRASVERDLAVASGEAQKAERRKSDLINQFLQRSLQSADPGQGGNQDMKVSVLMLKAVKDLDAGIFKDQPDVDAGLRLTIADILYSNGHAGDALPLAQKALEIYRQMNSGDSPEIARSLDTVALALHDVEPDAAVRELLIWQEALALHGPEIVRSLDIGDLALHDVEHDTAILEVLIGQEALAMRRRLYPAGHRDVAKSLTDVATTLRSMSLSEQAEPLLREALEMDRRLSHGDDRNVARDLDNMALVLVELQRPKEALSYAQDALAMRRRLFTGDNPDVAQSLSSLVHRAARARARRRSSRIRHAKRWQCASSAFQGTTCSWRKRWTISPRCSVIWIAFKRPKPASAMPWRCTAGFIQAIIRERPFSCQTWPNAWESSGRSPKHSTWPNKLLKWPLEQFRPRTTASEKGATKCWPI